MQSSARLQGSAHSGQQWFKLTSTLLNPTSTIPTYITDAQVIYSNITHSMFTLDYDIGHLEGY